MLLQGVSSRDAVHGVTSPINVSRNSYLEPWGRSAELRKTFDLAQRLGPFAHVFKEVRVLDAVPETERHFVSALARCTEVAA